ncbi:DUF983 domain-containing protein [Flavobacterium sp.]|uniref:DUF983 domain-containing protein n=1 Tax=Flavobacterium sp. TaxID=239 RepID=UPI00120056C5|nr:DUF983 domain-containing protein [Flavobacterium sp.]RZJ72538.1 MAG: DUF983 domain-containing protein [Flavobacterium sp.]
MFTKKSRLYSMITGTCPKCHEESMYVNQNPYNISETMKMHEHCQNCGFQYKIEPNFFFGAMYVSYALSVGAGVGTFLISKVGFGMDLLQSFAAIFGVLIFLMPLITRLSRNIYINLFVGYDA